MDCIISFTSIIIPPYIFRMMPKVVAKFAPNIMDRQDSLTRYNIEIYENLSAGYSVGWS
jgi:hypothetical protein